MKKLISVVVVFTILFSIILPADPARAEDLAFRLISEHTYGKLCKVAGFDFNEDLVLFLDWNGQIWEWDGIEDWEIGDFASMVFFDNLTPNTIYDDIILSASYERVDLVWGQ